ncbi:nuclear transport factor 2 family protein [Spirillospora sp. NPDC000708]
MNTETQMTAGTGATPKDVVVRYVRAVADGDLETIRDSFAEDATWTYPGDLPLSGTWKGRDAIVDDFLGAATGGLFKPGTAPEVALVNVIAEGDQVLAEWTAKGVTRSGKIYDNRCAGIYVVRDGRIVSVKEYADTRHVERTLFGQR